MADGGNGTVVFTPGYIAETESRWVSVPSVVFTAVIPLFVASRFWARLLASRKAFVDDWTLLVAAIFCIANNVIFIFMVENGYGHHLDAIPLIGNRKVVFLLYWLVQQVYKISLHLVKISLILFYWRLFKSIRWFKIVSMALLVVIVIYTLITVFLGFFQCTPVSKAWIRDQPGTCIDLTPFWTSNASFSISTDFILLLYPIPLLCKLQIPVGQKLGLIPVFGLGAFVTAISIVRLEPLRRAADSHDITFDLEGTFWTILEVNLAIVCASLPWTWVLMTRLFPSLLGRRKSSTSSSSSSATTVVASTVGGGRSGSRSIDGRSGPGPASVETYERSKAGSPWSRAEAKYGAGASIGRYSGGGPSEEAVSMPMGGIQKTIDYTVEFSRYKSESVSTDRSDMV